MREGVGARDSVLRAAGLGPSPPISGWEYLDVRRQRWEEDTTLEATLGEGESCDSVSVSLFGGSEVQEEAGGTYLATGRWSAGRQVYQQQGGPGLYLAVVPGSTQWTVRAALSPSSRARLASASAGALCPCSPSTSSSARYLASSLLLHLHHLHRQVQPVLLAVQERPQVEGEVEVCG